MSPGDDRSDNGAPDNRMLALTKELTQVGFSHEQARMLAVALAEKEITKSREDMLIAVGFSRKQADWINRLDSARSPELALISCYGEGWRKMLGMIPLYAISRLWRVLSVLGILLAWLFSMSPLADLFGGGVLAWL